MVSIDDEFKEYFKSLIVPLATTVSLEEMFSTFSNKVISKLEKKLDEQEATIQLQNKKNRGDGIATYPPSTHCGETRPAVGD